jgi:cytidine deaminase
MITTHSFSIDYISASSYDDISELQRSLLLAAKDAARLAYAPYSLFPVGAAALLSNGEIVRASNKENAAFPAGICAERNLMNYVSDAFPSEKILSIAVIADPTNFHLDQVLTPCGVCRQVMCEFEKVQGQEFQIILASQTGEVLIFSSAASLLPLQFQLNQLKK